MTDVKNQVLLAEEIKSVLTNFKKDGADRKSNAEYVRRKLKKLEELWKEFQFNHDRLYTETPRTDPYFTKQIYETTEEQYKECKSLMNEELWKNMPSTPVRAEPTKEVGNGLAGTSKQLLDSRNRDSAKGPVEQEYKSHGVYSRIDETLRKQEANFRAFQRTVANIDIEALTAKWEYEDALKTLNARWEAIDTLHLEIDSELNGDNITYDENFASYEKQYNTLKKTINTKMWSVSHREKTTPKLEIPIFSGNYNQWVSFKDLFVEAIHANPALSNAQKMQFLKAKLRGEAERLIQHLPITSDNYTTCWEILNHRYNNKRMIFTSHMNILFGLPNIQQNSMAQIKRLHDVSMETFNAIKNLGIDITTWDPILVHILGQKLDSETYTDYLESLKNTRDMPVLQELLDFLESKFTTLETSARRRQDGQQKPNTQHSTNIQQHSSSYRKPVHTSNNYKSNGNYAAIAKPIGSGFRCPLCKGDHGIYNCKIFLQMPNDKKLNAVNRLSLCINCLFSHNGKTCNSTKRCRNCQAAHSTILHDALSKSTNNTATTSANKEHVGSNAHVAQTQNEHLETLLATADLKVMGADGSYYNMRVMVDPGSQLSLITEQAAQLLRSKREKHRGTIFGVCERENNFKGKINITCKSNYSDDTFIAEVIIVNNLIKELPNKTFSKPSWPIINNIELADPEFYISRKVDMIFGAEVYANIILEGIKNFGGKDATQPLAQQSRIGWLLSGKPKQTNNTFYCNVVIDNLEDLQQFWEVEDVTEEEDLSAEDVTCIQYFQETTVRKQDGRYQVRLPMKPNFENNLGASKQKAIAQFRNLEQKFEKQPKLASDYKTFMNEYAELQHMMPADGNKSLECYLGHHGIERVESSTTRYRVVFNASAKTSTGYSLNDLMYKGPNLQQDLQFLLLRWRQYRYAFTADIEKMYRQILIHEDDACLQRIIWRESTKQPLQTFELKTITYGMKAGPFLAMMTLKKLAEDERDNFPEASRILEQSFYMDDLVHGVHSIEQGKKIIKNLDQLLKTGGFNLRKWSANSTELLTDMTGQQNSVIFNFKSDVVPKTLGICWNPTKDTFTFRYETTQHNKITKRILLSEISKVFDPLGWVAPVVTKMKLLFQSVWKSKMEWNTEVPEDIYKEWNKVQTDLNKLNEYEIPRWLNSREHDVIELHGFCDASIAAYAGVIYARVKNQEKVVLVAAKTKLVPLKSKITLPKLELSSAHLLAKLMSKVKRAFENREINTYGWTDSKVALGWLQGEPNRWKPFVANRVKQITEVMPSKQWHYVNTKENPADAASRGWYASQLLSDQSLWKTGPTWLTTFRPENIEQETFTTDHEEKTFHSNVIQQSNPDQNIIEQLLNKYSSLQKIIHILAWIQRALTPKRKQRPSYLTLQEIRKAKLTIIKHVQQREFGEEIEHLRKHECVQKQSKLKQLNPFLDQQQILRVKGRLDQALMSEEMKHPKIIPRESRLATLLIDQAHKLTLHGGATLTLSSLRQEYWITGGYNTVKRELLKCVTCRKQEGKKQVQLMGDLPAARCNPAKPFYHTGVDYTGAVDIKASKGRGARTLKGYIAIFICMVTKAVHLELVTDLTSSAFLAALRRMAARRGAPAHMYSDNGKNFVGGNRKLQEGYQHLQHITDNNFLAEITGMNIEWHFNAPSWPSAGGIWERAVRSLKHHLKRVVGEQKLTFEEYSTILTLIEGCLNSRPLCALNDDINNLDFLTPNHFLSPGRPDVTVIDTAEDARTRWHLSQKIFQDIFKRWKTEYLTQLTARTKWQEPQQNIEIGNMVVIHEDNLPPGKWAMGRVIDVHPGKDGHVRVVTLKTKSGELKRPITKLSLLPIDKQTSESTETSEPKNKKKQRTSTNKQRPYVLSLLMMFLYILTIATQGTCMQTTQLTKNQALYFDKVADMQIIRDEWKIIAYYNLDPYWEGAVAFTKYYQHLDNICTQIKPMSHCELIMLQLRHGFEELEHNNKVLLKQQMRTRARRRRGLVNGVGNIANTLFGVLDSRFAEQYERDIALVRENQRHLAQLWKNQTSVVEAEYNLLQRTENTIQRQHKIINNHLTRIEMNSFAITKQVNELDVTSEFTLIAMAATNILTHLKGIQMSLLDTITDIHNGHINVNLISPQQLQNELSIISGQLDKELTLPIDNIQLDLTNIYHLLRIKGVMTKRYILLEIRVPLISRDNYDLYNIQAIPRQVGKNMLVVIPIESHIAMNLQKDSYLPITTNELERCLSRDSTTYLCQLNSPIYKMKSDLDFCVREVNTIDRCKTNLITCQNKWINLSSANQYLSFCCDKCNLRNLCKDQVTAHQLTGANIINIPEGCIIKMENLTVYTHKKKESTINITPDVEVPNIAPINHVINITIQNMEIEMTTDGSTALLRESIEQKIKTMKEEQPLTNEISIHDIHHYTLIYGILIVGVIIIIFLGWRRIQSQRETVAATSRQAAEVIDSPEAGPQPPPTRRNTDCVKASEPSESARVQINDRDSVLYTERGTTPVLIRKIAFSDDSM
ncbi:uncharacterized protein LOC134669601 [Cydia fagiglandana]|uniref:uncharacterized protein LOC134669601 n=1 Tax=Cydia fagiglandana TaxID=1458189 RepID=UPI002FEE3038